MFVSSQAIPAGSTITRRCVAAAAGGGNVSPDLTWGDVPSGTKSFAITCFDPDAPRGGFWHWVVVDIPATVTTIPEGGPVPSDGRELPSDFGTPGWGGPCPPRGPAHRYVFTVYALDIPKLAVPARAGGDAVVKALKPHILDSAHFTGMFRNPA